MLSSAETILSAIERVPAINVQLDDVLRSAELRVDGRLVARVDLRGGDVFVSAPAETIPTLQRLFPSARATGDGIAFHLADPRGSSEALAAIRRRASVERFGWQLGVASP